jgi:acetoin utilization deacetylase AcuC-like enzyme
MTTGFLYDPVFLSHDTGLGHPESPERLVATMDYLRQQSWYSKLKLIAPRMIERMWVEEIHTAEYIERATEACRQDHAYLDVLDVSISRESCDVAMLAAGGVIALTDSVISGEIDNGFALIRPPGHHAERNMALGFCLFNNVAILARYLQEQHGLHRILILDWDVHHGNGTQHTFEEEPAVLYISLHQYPFYPGTGAAHETGKGRGRGATLNCPMPAGATDEDYRTAFSGQILPKVDAFKPEAVLISAGFDAHADDPLAQINLSTEFYGWMSQRMIEAAEKHAHGRLISMLEGGYDLYALPRCIGMHLRVLLDGERG